LVEGPFQNGCIFAIERIMSQHSSESPMSIPLSSENESMPSLFDVVLIEPEIPQNTGNIGRTCVATRSRLHLVEPFGFELSDRTLKRAGLDYWPHLDWARYPDFSNWSQTLRKPERVFYFTTKATQLYTEVQYQVGDTLVFGKETKGLSPEIIQRNEKQIVKIPLLGPARSLNLATAVAIAAYEVVRQLRVR
jgi:tRNA (cytidine/uridine-2'-O-)-methyltransferase